MRLKLPPEIGFLIGIAALSYGFWLAWKPLGFIIGGLIITAVSFLRSYSRQAR